MTNLSKHSIRYELKKNLSLSIPLIVSWLVYAFSGFIGTAMVARLGAEALAASVLVGTIWSALTVFFFGIFNAVSVLVSHQFGARNFQQVSFIFSQAFLIGLLICVPVILVMTVVPFTLQFFVTDQRVLKYASDYAFSLVWCTPAVVILIIFENLLNGIGKTKLSLWISLLEVPFEILLIYILVFGKFGLPQLGIAGVGYGFTAAYGLTVIGLITYLSLAKFAKEYQIFKTVGKYHRAYFREIVRVGFPVGFMYLIEVAAFMVVTFMMIRFSTTTLAAHQITMQYLGLFINIPFAMGQAVSIRIGMSIGRHDKLGIYYASYIGMTLNFLIALLLGFIYIVFPHYLLAVDIDLTNPANAALLSQATTFLMLLALFQFADAMRIMETSILRAVKDTKFPMYISILSFWVIDMALAYWLGIVLHYAGVGIWIGLTMGVFLGAIILFARMRYMLKRVDTEHILTGFINN